MVSSSVLSLNDVTLRSPGSDPVFEIPDQGVPWSISPLTTVHVSRKLSILTLPNAYGHSSMSALLYW
jgi:hypothetical protein